MIKEIETPYKFMRNFEEAKEILLSIECGEKYTIIKQNQENGKCVVEKNLPGCKPYFSYLENDYEIYFAGERDFSMYLDYYRTDELRKRLTKKHGQEYVDGLEEFLDNKTKKEVAKYRKILEGEVE